MTRTATEVANRRLDAFFDSGYIQHSPLAAAGAAGLKGFLDRARQTSPRAEHRDAAQPVPAAPANQNRML